MDSSPTFKLADSTKAIPAVGFGCWKVAKDLAPSVVEAAIKNGYRHIDCAADYGKRKYLILQPKLENRYRKLGTM